MKKEIIVRNGGIFILSLIGILLSIKILGRDNLMVGANAVFLLVGILNKNFSNKPVKSILKVIALMMFIGALPFFVNLNDYTGLLINFLGIFILLYAIVYNLNKSIYYPFLFGYTLLLASNVTGKALAYRIIGLAIVGLVAVLFQIFYIKICVKRKMSSLKRSLSLLINYINNECNEDSYKELDKFMEANATWSRELLEYRGSSFYLNYKENIELNLIAILDKLGNIHSNITLNKNNSLYYLKDDVIEILKTINLFINEKIKEEDLEYAFKIFKSKHMTENNINIFELIVSIETFKKMVVELDKLETGNFKVSKKIKLIDIKESLKIIFADFNTKSIRFVFSFRTALLISITYFIIQYYHIEYGKWIIFTIASVSQPYNETIKNRARDRILGTLIGAGIYYGLSLIFVDEISRVFIILVAIYFYVHFKKYIQNVAMITVMFLGLATLNVVNTIDATEWRIFFIVVGSILVLLGNKFIFPYNLEKETKILLDKYLDCCNKAFMNITSIYESNLERQRIKNLILHARALENKIILNTDFTNNLTFMNLIEDERIIINCIQNTFNLSEIYDITLRINGTVRMNKIKLLIAEVLDEKNITLDDFFNNAINTEEKLIYKDMYQMSKAKLNLNTIKSCLNN
ncbi:FUSC family protein [uncultured Clostridium sp.]|uniref:FUSC family protein n=1 Tax=uncultured Clostridium sp. TaxID=59620 RepID=UPI00260A682F|nr:FUSC family protein [uncultured Clostridium sp.]